MLKGIAISSHSGIVHVTVRLMRYCTSCDLEHRVEVPISGQELCPLATKLRGKEGP